MEKDERPLCSPAPEWVRQLSHDFCDRLDKIFEELWEKAIHGAAAAVERGEATAAEAQNDALSVFSQVSGAYGIICLAEKIGAAKQVPPAIAFSVALHEAQARASVSFIVTAAAHGHG